MKSVRLVLPFLLSVLLFSCEGNQPDIIDTNGGDGVTLKIINAGGSTIKAVYICPAPSLDLGSNWLPSPLDDLQYILLGDFAKGGYKIQMETDDNLSQSTYLYINEISFFTIVGTFTLDYKNIEIIYREKHFPGETNITP